MSEGDDVSKLDDGHFLTLCMFVLDHGKLFPEQLQPQIAARLRELLNQGTVSHASVTVLGQAAIAAVGTVTVTKPRGRRPGRLREAVQIVRDIMAANAENIPQATVCASIALAYGMKPATLEREYQKLKQKEGESGGGEIKI